MNLLETYKNRIAVAESVYSKTHEGGKLDSNKKITLATVLNNTARFLNEAFDASSGTQRSDMGLWKKFTLNLTTVALPNLIANELVIVHPMTSMSGYVTYIEYLAGTKKGATNQGDLFNSPFKLGNVDPTYTSDRVVESVEAGTGAQALAWTPLVHGAITYNDTVYDIKLVKAGAADIYGYYKDADKKFYSDAAYTTQITVASDTKVAYVYDNVIVPQNDLPTLKAEMKSIPLIARARRIAVERYAA